MSDGVNIKHRRCCEFLYVTDFPKIRYWYQMKTNFFYCHHTGYQNFLRYWLLYIGLTGINMDFKNIVIKYIQPVVLIISVFLKIRKIYCLNLRSQSLQFCVNKTFDFSTLHTTIPHAQLEDRLHRLIKQIFFYKNGNRRYTFLDLGYADRCRSMQS